MARLTLMTVHRTCAKLHLGFDYQHSAVDTMQGLPEYQAVARNFKRGVLISEVPRFSLQVNAGRVNLLGLYNIISIAFVSSLSYARALSVWPGWPAKLRTKGCHALLRRSSLQLPT